MKKFNVALAVKELNVYYYDVEANSKEEAIKYCEENFGELEAIEIENEESNFCSRQSRAEEF